MMYRNIHMKHTSLQRQAVTRACALLKVATAIALASVFPTVAIAASSWSPTLLVNTESFQIIDSGDDTTNRELRFGDTSTEKLLFDGRQLRFEFTRGLEVRGNLTATGSLTVSGAVILNDAAGDNDVQIQGGTDANLLYTEAGTDRVGIGTATPDTKFEVVGTISGSALKTIGNLSVSGSTFLEGSLTGSTIGGFGLYDCEGTTNKLTWDSSTGKFKCEADQQAASGLTYSTAEGIFVNQGGDTMTGALRI